jgi:hypothetical protein
MARVSRSQLKTVVKECLIEILSEGIGISSEKISTLTEARQRRVPPRRKDGGARETLAVIEPNEGFDQAIKRNVNLLTSNPILQGILDDTARTTLQEHLASDRLSGKQSILDQGHGPVDEIPLEPFSGASSRWAALAFQDDTSSE